MIWGEKNTKKFKIKIGMKLKKSQEKESKLKAFQETRKLKYFGLLCLPTEQNILSLLTIINHHSYDVEFESLA